MRRIVRKEDYPALFHHSEPTAEKAIKFLTHNTAEEIIQHQNKESMEVWKGVKALVEGDYVWGSFIVEGVAILPDLAAELMNGNKKVRAIFLIDEDINRIREVIFTRGLWNDADKYPDDIKEKEIEWVLAFNNFIKQEAGKYNLPIVQITDRNSYIQDVSLLVKKDI